MVAEEVATDKQIEYIQGLLTSRRMQPELRQDVQALLDRVMSKGEASQVIPYLKDLPPTWRDRPPSVYDGRFRLLLQGVPQEQPFLPEDAPESLKANFRRGVAEHNATREESQQATQRSPYDIRLALAKVINDADGDSVPVSALRQIIAEANEAARTVGIRD